MSNQPKKTIDERLEALTTSVEVMSGMLKDMLEENEKRAKEAEERFARAEKRERKARQAIMAGIAAYMAALQDGDEA